MLYRPDNGLWGFEAPREFQLRMGAELWGRMGTHTDPRVETGPSLRMNHLEHDGEETTVSSYGHVHSTNSTYLVICCGGTKRAMDAQGWMMATATYEPSVENLLYGTVQREAHDLVGLGRSHLLAHLTLCLCQGIAAEAWRSAERGEPLLPEDEPVSPEEVLERTGMTMQQHGAFDWQ